MKYLEDWKNYISEEQRRGRPGAIVFIIDTSGRLLIVKRANTAAWMPGKWAAPGGGIEPGETPAQAGAREVSEETGLTVRDLKQFRIRKGKYFYFVTKNFQGDVQLNPEHTSFEWIDINDVEMYDHVPLLGEHAWMAYNAS